MPTISKGLRQAYELQDLVYDVTVALKQSMTSEKGEVSIRRDEYGKPTDAAAIAQLVKAWESCQERISFHRRIPSPGSLKPEAKRKGARPGRPGIAPLVMPHVDTPSGAPAVG